jgi:hypothetical protein
MGLPAAQRVKVDAWLFEDGFTYKEVVEACLSEFGLKVSRSSVGRYYERTSADRFAEKKRKERMALLPELSPAEAYEVLLQRIGTIALELMDEEVVNSKVVVRLVRVLIAARREKHMATRVWVERRKVENWMARECLRHWRREMRKKPHPSYLPICSEGKAPAQPGSLRHLVAESPDKGHRGAQGAGAKRKGGAFRAENRRKSELTPMFSIV